MSENEIKDDYYSSLSSEKKDVGNKIDNKTKIKPKVVIKKKVITQEIPEKKVEPQEIKKDIKKVQKVTISFDKPAEIPKKIYHNKDKKTQEKVENVKKEYTKPKILEKEAYKTGIIVKKDTKEGFQQKAPFKRDFYRKEGTESKTPYLKREFIKKDFVKKDIATSGGYNNQNQKKYEPRNNNNSNVNLKTEGNQKDGVIQTNFKRGLFDIDPNVEGLVIKNTFVKKDFGKDKPKAGFNNRKSDFGDKSKKPKLSPYSKNRRFFPETKDPDNFVLSNKINKKSKEVKNIEDIKQNLTSRAGETVVIGDILSLKELSEKIGIPLVKLLAEFMKNGMTVNVNSKIDFETASIISDSFDVKLERDKSLGINVEDIINSNLSDLLVEDDITKLKDRPPVISIIGHVDHGKTSLLDYIRQEKVAEGEAGGITQSIGAYQVVKNGKKMTFLDTPGHEAFSIMRARGVKSTDIAILVVAADEGVKPQTIESINHAKEAGISIIVAMNKMDKEGVNVDLLKSQLAEHGLVSEEWGGDTPMIPVSAKTGFGIDDLLEMILLVAEMKELKANPDRLGIGTILESHLDMQLGPVATVLINAGSINMGDSIVCKESYGKIKVLKNYKLENIKSAFSGDPVLIVGLNNVATGGDLLQVVPTIELAKNKSLEYKDIIYNQSKSKTSSLDLIMSMIKSGALKNLKIVVKADTNGSLEAIKGALLKLSTPETKVSIIHSGVGNITEGDLLMCIGSSAILIGFGVDILLNAQRTLDSFNIEYINSPIIYKITERIEKIITGMLDPKEVEVVFGNAIVAGIFYTSKEFMIVGLRIKEGEKIENKLKIRVLRKSKVVGKGEILSLKHGVEEVRMLEGPIECGIKFAGNVVIEEGDILEIYKSEIHK